MLTLYTTPTALSCRKARLWLNRSGVPYQERKIYSSFLTWEEFRHISGLLREKGLTLLSLWKKPLHVSREKVVSLSEEELYQLFQKYPGRLRRPLLVGETSIEIGFSETGFQQLLLQENLLLHPADPV